MYPAAFDYVRASSVDDALAQLGDGGKLLAGGHSLLPVMKLRLAAPGRLIDIGRIDGMRGIEQSGDGFTIGALTTHAMVAAAGADGFPAGLAEAAGMIGDPQVRNRGTVGGNVAHADPASDLPTILLALSATFHATGSGGSRSIAAGDFFTGLFETALGDDEILTGVEVASEGAGTGSAYAKLFNPASRYAVVAAGATVSVDGDGNVTGCNVAVGGLTSKATDTPSVAAALVGGAASADRIEAAAAAAAGDVGSDVIGDIHASADYRVSVLPTFVAKALESAAARAG